MKLDPNANSLASSSSTQHCNKESLLTALKILIIKKYSRGTSVDSVDLPWAFVSKRQATLLELRPESHEGFGSRNIYY